MDGQKKLPGKLRMGMETFLSVNLDTMNNPKSSIMNIVSWLDVMISLLMTALVMGYVVRVVLDITKEAFTVGKRFSMVVTLDLTQLNISVEKIFARKTRLQNEYKSKHRTCLHFGRKLHIFSCSHITIINTDHNFKINALFSTNTK